MDKLHTTNKAKTGLVGLGLIAFGSLFAPLAHSAAEIAFFVLLPSVLSLGWIFVLDSRSAPKHWTARQVVSAWLVSPSKDQPVPTAARVEVVPQPDPTTSVFGADIVYESPIEEVMKDGVCGSSELRIFSPGIVYLMRREDGAIKIGMTNGHVRKRHAEICRACGDIELLAFFPHSAPWAVEKYLHTLLQSKGCGAEWFKLTDDEVEAVKHLIGEHLNFDQINGKFFTQEASK